MKDTTTMTKDGERLAKLKLLERKVSRLRDNIETELKRELLIQFHAHCFRRADYATKLDDIAKNVAVRLTL